MSIEEDMKFVEKTGRLLEKLGVQRCVRIIHAPLREQIVDGIRTTCYQIGDDAVAAISKDSGPNMVIVDGPTGEPGVGWGTLPLVQRFVSPGSWFYLDDALRDGELKIAEEWGQLPHLAVEGIVLTGKGLLIGRVRGV